MIKFILHNKILFQNPLPFVVWKYLVTIRLDLAIISIVSNFWNLLEAPDWTPADKKKIKKRKEKVKGRWQYPEVLQYPVISLVVHWNGNLTCHENLNPHTSNIPNPLRQTILKVRQVAALTFPPTPPPTVTHPVAHRHRSNYENTH